MLTLTPAGRKNRPCNDMEAVEELFRKYTGRAAESVSEIGASGSPRRYFRLAAGNMSAVGAVGTDADENRAFLAVCGNLRAHGISAPEVFAVSADGMSYLQQDLGDVSLYSMIEAARKDASLRPELHRILHQVMADLPKIQFGGADGLDWSVCYPEPAFGPGMVMFDLNYFKYCFLKSTGVQFNEIRLQNDLEGLCAALCRDVGDTFMYRDFQSRNVMIYGGMPWYIDFQGGRRGPVQYDVASFLWQARAAYPDDLKKELLDTYVAALRTYVPALDEEAFRSRLALFVLFRMLQVLGAYGFRGYFEGKRQFAASVPAALANIRRLLQGEDPVLSGNASVFAGFPYLCGLLEHIAGLPRFARRFGEHSPCAEASVRPASVPEPLVDVVQEQAPCPQASVRHVDVPEPQVVEASAEIPVMTVEVYSFSYKKGIPEDASGNGGGYVFDCRSTHNPGRIPYYRQFTGLDEEVIRYLEDDGEITSFLSNVYPIVDHHVERFAERGFSHLQIAFGCTGGQHRSVYCAQHTAEHIKERFGVRVHLVHREQGIDTEL